MARLSASHALHRAALLAAPRAAAVVLPRPRLSRAASGSAPRSAPTAAAATPRRYRRRVAVGLSGGVDSSVAALLLQRAGWDVVGVFIRSWDGSDEAGAGVCSATDDLRSAQAVAAQLGIPLRTLDLTSAYWTHVFEPFLASYAAGKRRAGNQSQRTAERPRQQGLRPMAAP
jgi:NH3-dependent NAD+ synthetase